MGFKNNDRCLAKVDEDEPIFVLRAQDKSSIDTIHHWLEGAKETLTPEHYQETRQCIDEFARWQQTHAGRVKNPD